MNNNINMISTINLIMADINKVFLNTTPDNLRWVFWQEKKVRRITLSPINLTSRYVYGNKALARIDYRREQPRFRYGTAKYDDCKTNNTQVGDYFGFVRHTENIVEIFEVTSILPALERPDYWTIPAHRKRNVLCLSPVVSTMRWCEMKRRLGYKPRHILKSTSRSRKAISIAV